MLDRIGLSALLALTLALAGCPGEADDDDDSAAGDDDAGDDDACDALAAGPTTDWDGAAALDPGAVAELAGSGGSFSFSLTETGADYLAIVISRTTERDTTWPLDVGGGGRAGTPPADADAGGEVPHQPPVSGGGAPDGVPIGDSSVPEVGDVRTFNVAGAMGFTAAVQAEAIHVTDEVVFYEDIDTDNPLPDIDLEWLEEMLETFESVVLPRERFFFDTESDVNGDGHVSAIFSYRVNEYGAMAYVSHCDLLPADQCADSNEQELIYVGIPDPDENYSSVNGVAELMAHEFNHNIYWASKYLDNDAIDTTENVYVTEGMSALAQDLTGFNNGNLYVWSAALDEPWHCSASDTFVYEAGAHYDSQRDGPLRGLAYLQLRYLYDRYGAEDARPDGTFGTTCGVEFLHDWFATPTAGFDAVEETTGLGRVDYVTDFWTALGTHQRCDTGDCADPAYHFQPPAEDVLTGYQRGVDFTMTIHGWKEVSGVATFDLLEAQTLELRAGGATYLLAEDLAAAAEVTIETDPAADAIVRVVRLD